MAAKKPAKPAKKKANTGTMLDAAALCDCTPATVRNIFMRNPDCPAIIQRGNKKQAWVIDLDKLDKWREKTGFLKFEKVEADDPASHRIPTGVRKKDQIQAELLQLELDQKTGKVIEREPSIKVIKTAFAVLAKRLDMLPNVLGKKLGWTPDDIVACHSALDEYRAALVQNIAGLFAQYGNELSADAH